MAVLGYGGRIRLKREAPEPTVIRPGNIHVATNSIYMRNQAFWSGDQVTLSCIDGLPIDTSNNGPDCPNGYGTYYGSDWTTGSNRDHITSESSAFYSGSDGDQFYMRENECGLTTSANYYIYRDQLDRLSFYSNRADALNGATGNRVPIYKVDFNGLIIAASGTTEYDNAIATCASEVGEYTFSDMQDEVSLALICDFAPEYTSPPPWITEYDNADLTPRYYINAGATGMIWTIQCELTNWTLNLNSPEVDITAVGERFGESVKSIVTGGGTIDFLVDRSSAQGESDSTYLMQLLLLSEKGSKADAEFWMINNAQATQSNNLLPGDLYYSTSLLVTSIAINVRASDLIVGSMNFVTVGEIALKMGTN